ncbi:hypothetical protein D3C87_1765990 [compost metagenome]
MLKEEQDLIDQAIASQGAKDDTPSGATLRQLTEFANAGRWLAFSALYKRHQKEFPTNSHYIEANVEAKVRNGLLVRTDVTPSALQEYISRQKDFVGDTFGALQHPATFDGYMAGIEADLKS